ncbi:MAG: hypothetical protein V1826_02550 [bacterium]
MSLALAFGIAVFIALWGAWVGHQAGWEFAPSLPDRNEPACASWSVGMGITILIQFSFTLVSVNWVELIWRNWVVSIWTGTIVLIAIGWIVGYLRNNGTLAGE